MRFSRLATVLVMTLTLTSCSYSSPGCFEAGTKIKTPTGWTEIQDLKAGDQVLTYSLTEERVLPGIVDKTTRREVDQIGTLTLESGVTVQVTGDHPVFVPGSAEPMRVDHLNAGDEVRFLNDDGSVTGQKVKSVTFKAKKVAVYNIKVKDTHSTFAAGILAKFYE